MIIVTMATAIILEQGQAMGYYTVQNEQLQLHYLETQSAATVVSMESNCQAYVLAYIFHSR